MEENLVIHKVGATRVRLGVFTQVNFSPKSRVEHSAAVWRRKGRKESCSRCPIHLFAGFFLMFMCVLLALLRVELVGNT